MASTINWISSSHHLYDREAQLQALREAYERNQQTPSNPELVLITGASGSGKSALASSLKPLVEGDCGFFLKGKSDDQIQDPHAPFISVVDEFVQQVPSQNKEVICMIQESITDLVGSEISLLIKAIPSLSKILRNDSALSDTEDAPVVRLGRHSGTEDSTQGYSGFDLDVSITENSFHVGVQVSNDNPARFVSVFCRLLKSIASIKPLCLLIDDLQWTDSESLNILEALLDENEPIGNLMLVGTCRGNEVDTQDRLATLLRKLEDKGVKLTDIQVHNLSQNGLVNMICDALGLTPAEVLPLAQVVHGQTKGNVFFAKQYLQCLVEEGVLYHDAISHKWKWDENALVLALSSAGNGDLIINLLSRKMQQLPSYVLETLKTIACMGSCYNENVLISAGTVVSSQVLNALEVASAHGFITYDADTGFGQFVHDKFREAALSLIPPDEKRKFHLNIGRNLRRQWSVAMVKANVILIVDQIKHGLDLVTDPEEKDYFARLFLKASNEAAKKSAFVAGTEYVNHGISILSQRNWRDQYNLSLELYSTGAELGYCTGNHELLNSLAAQVNLNAQSVGDKNRVLVTRLMAHAGTGNSAKGIDMCHAALKDLNMSFPRNPGPLSVMFELLLVRQAIGRKTEEDILSLPPLEDPCIVSAMKVYFVMFNFFETAGSDGAPITAFRMVRLTLRHGLSPFAALGFHLYGICMTKLGYMEDGDRYGRLSLQLLDRFPSKQLEGKIKFLHWGIIEASKASFRSVVGPMWNAGTLAWETGDVEMAVASRVIQSTIRLSIGDPIPNVSKVLTEYVDLCETYGQPKVAIIARGGLQFCHNVQGLVENPLVLTGDVMDEDESIHKLHKSEMAMVLIPVLHLKYLIATLMNEHEFADELYQRLGASFKGFAFPFLSLYFDLLHGLVAAALARESNGRSQKRKLARVKHQCTKMKRRVIHNPDNTICKMYLLDAEMEFCQKRFSAALLKYERAISSAKLQGFVSDQAIACEKAGMMLQHAGRKQEAVEYLQQAKLLYMEWGIRIKVDQLEKFLMDMNK